MIEAAQKLDENPRRLQSWLAKFAERAGRRGYSRLSSPAPLDTMPEGQELKELSTLVDENGELDAQWIKTQRKSDEAKHVKPPPDHVITRTATYRRADGTIGGGWATTDQKKLDRWNSFWEAAEKSAEDFRGLVTPTATPVCEISPLLALYGIGDHHAGMLSHAAETGNDYDLKIAEQDLNAAIDLCLANTPSTPRALLVNIGDFVHADTDQQITPRGHNKLDVDTRSGKIKLVCFRMLRRAVGLLLLKHEQVEMINAPGNHDPETSRMLNLLLQVAFENEPRVKIYDNYSSYTYVTHGRTLIGTCHGDGPKPERLPGIMARDVPRLWGEALFRYWITGHVHHKVVREFDGCTTESLNVLPPGDKWHNDMGYGATRSIISMLFHELYGKVGTFVAPIEMVRDRIAGTLGALR